MKKLQFCGDLETDKQMLKHSMKVFDLVGVACACRARQFGYEGQTAAHKNWAESELALAKSPRTNSE